MADETCRQCGQPADMHGWAPYNDHPFAGEDAAPADGGPLARLLHQFDDIENLESVCTACGRTTVLQILGKDAPQALCPSALASFLDRVIERVGACYVDSEDDLVVAMSAMAVRLRATEPVPTADTVYPDLGEEG